MFVRLIIPFVEVVSIVDPLNQMSKNFLCNKESSDLLVYVRHKLTLSAAVIIEYSESAYLSLHHICHIRARSTYEKSMIYLNEVTLTVIYELVSVSYLKLLVLTT